MLTKKIFFILISLVIVFGLAGPVAADAPQTVECQILWVTSDYQEMNFMAEGQLIENGHGFELTCDYVIDFSDPEIGSITQFCEYWGPWACNAHGNNIVIQNIYFYFEYNGEVLEIADASYMVNTNGQLNFHAQYAPDQCSELKSFNWTLDLPPGYWVEGTHSYTMDWDIYGEDYFDITNTFTVTLNAPLLTNHVRMGMGGLSSGQPIINPGQETFIQITEYIASSLVFIIEADRANSSVWFSLDGGEPILIQPSPITNFCGFDNAFLVRTYGYAK